MRHLRVLASFHGGGRWLAQTPHAAPRVGQPLEQLHALVVAYARRNMLALTKIAYLGRIANPMEWVHLAVRGARVGLAAWVGGFL